MCFFRYGLLAVPLLAACAAFAAEPPRYLQGVPARATHGASVRVPDLHWAAREGDVAEVKRLIAAGADVNATETLYGGRALHWAALGGESGVVRALIAAGAELEAQNAAGETALFQAVRTNDAGNYDALTALLIAGADPNASVAQSTTVLHVAASVSDLDFGFTAVLLLRRFGADPNATDAWGATPLHYAVSKPFGRGTFGGLELAAASLDPQHRALDVNARDINGMTPLHSVMTSLGSARDLQVLRWLVHNGADVNAVDNSGWTPLDWADDMGPQLLPGFARYLRAAGGENRRIP